MKVTVDDDACCGHGVCLATCPDVFDLSDSGYAVVTVDEIPPEYENAVRDAAAQCPERAISISS